MKTSIRRLEESKHGNNKKIKTSCESCGKVFWESKSHYIKKKKHFCCIACYSDYRKKQPKHKQPSWKGGKTTSTQGYKIIYLNGKICLKHRYLMEKYLGRKLNKDEVVHHIDRNRKNNKIENLDVMTRSEHMRFHRLNQ